ncbi:MAG: hypothetical protein JRH18_15615 [Deltaproteobacteria bacterium]|nr:hypothetical protein [Deltaproteobacteria bacterium]MBW2153084.1 hypothetical protein [Deltaproteobacteria bacterium]
MTYFFYSCICLVLVVVQTAILPVIPGGGEFYDLLALFVFYLSIFRSVREGLPVVFAIGFTMDNLSGAPFGLYMTTYFWLFVIVKWITGFLRVRNVILLPVLMGCGTIIQSLIFLGPITSTESWPWLQVVVIKTGVVQVLWAVTTGPILLLLLSRLHQQWDQLMMGIMAQREGQSE